MKTISYKLPAYWASYLVNGDASSLQPGEEQQIQYFLACHSLGSPCGVSEEEYFSHSNDAHTGLGGDVLDYTFFLPKRTRMISKKSAQTICGHWHGGQWSALYSFASTGRFYPEKTLQYFKEIETCLRPDFALHPGSLSKKQEKELNSLKKFMLNEARANGYPVEFEAHKVYGYLIPYLLDCVPDQKANNVEQVMYMA